MSSDFGQIEPRTSRLARPGNLIKSTHRLIMRQMVYPLFLACFYLMFLILADNKVMHQILDITEDEVGSVKLV